MSYKKGKDIKIPFDCLWYYFTRKFEMKSFSYGYAKVDKYSRPEEFGDIDIGEGI